MQYGNSYGKNSILQKGNDSSIFYKGCFTCKSQIPPTRISIDYLLWIEERRKKVFLTIYLISVLGRKYGYEHSFAGEDQYWRFTSSHFQMTKFKIIIWKVLKKVTAITIKKSDQQIGGRV